MTLDGSTSGMVVPDAPALDPTGAITIEAWVLVGDTGGDCKNLIGKNFLTSWWVGVCGNARTLRSFVKGSSSQMNGGFIPLGQWTHIAVVYDGVQRLHYINGELVMQNPDTGPLTTSTDPLEVGMDAGFSPHTPKGSFNEVRLWSVARTMEQVRNNLNVPLRSSQNGLIAVWSLAGTTADSIGSLGGTLQGTAAFASFPAGGSCTSSTSGALCLSGRFTVTAGWRVGPEVGGATGSGTTSACSNPGSGLFWFFDANNWEVLLKIINGCALNNRWWVFSAATTDVFYRLEVFDLKAGKNKIYFNYPGTPAPAVTDTDAFDTCT